MEQQQPQQQQVVVDQEGKVDFTRMDDVLGEILRRFPIDEYCNISLVSKKLRTRTATDFHLNFPHLFKTIIIQQIGGVIGFARTERYIAYFGSSFESIEINYTIWEYNAELLRFIHDKCSKDIKRIHFDGLNVNNQFLDEMEMVLSKLEAVGFLSSAIARLAHTEDILRRSRELKYLKIVDDDSAVALPRNKYPCLTVFEYIVESTRKHTDMDNTDDLVAFFDENKTIKRFICCCMQLRLTERLLQIFGRSAVEELFLETDNFERHLIRLERQQNRKSFKQLELRLSQFKYCVSTLAPLKKLTGLHLELWRASNLDRLVVSNGPNNYTLGSVKILQFINCTLFPTTAARLVPKFPELEELHVDFLYDPFIAEFVRRSKKLKKIVVKKDQYVSSKINGLNNSDYVPNLEPDANRILQFNEQRAQLNGACKLTIYLDKKYPVSLQVIRQRSRNDFVVFKRILIRENRHRWDRDHPFIFHSYEVVGDN